MQPSFITAHIDLYAMPNLLLANAITEYLDKIISLGPVVLVAGLSLFCVVSLFFATVKPSRWLWFGLLLLFATLTRPIENQWWDLHLSPLIQKLSDYSRPATGALLASMFLGSLFVKRGNRRTIFSGPIIAFFALQLLICLNYFMGGAIERGLVTPFMYVFMSVSICYGLGASLQSPADCRTAVWSIAFVCMAILLLTCYEYGIRPESVVANGRLYAVTRNPQAAGTTFALSIVAMAYLITSLQVKSKLMKLCLVFATAIAVIFLVWTGSRTALLVLAIGGLVLYYDRLSVLALGGGIIAVAVLLLASLFSKAFVGSGRLLSTEDTRSEAWTNLIHQFLSNPVFGDSMTQSSAGESSYLGAAALMGIPGVLFMGAFLALLARMLFKLFKVRKYLGPDARLANLIMSGIIMICIASALDGYLLGSTTYHIFVLYLYLAMGAYLLEYAEVRQGSVSQIASAPIPLVQKKYRFG